MNNNYVLHIHYTKHPWDTGEESYIAKDGSVVGYDEDRCIFSDYLKASSAFRDFEASQKEAGTWDEVDWVEFERI